MIDENDSASCSAPAIDTCRVSDMDDTQTYVDGILSLYNHAQLTVNDVGRRLATARRRADKVAAAARAVAVQAVEDGHSEVSVAAALGVDRGTVRAWVGKPNLVDGRRK